MNGCDPAWMAEMRTVLYAGMGACILLLVILNWPEAKRDEPSE